MSSSLQKIYSLSLNLKLLNTEIQEFIHNNLNTNVSKLLFKNSQFKAVSNKEIVEQIEAKNKSKFKLSSWFSTKGIYYPNKLNIEQTSSEVLAEYKSKLITGKNLIDLTGGFGVDSFYFSKQFKKVTHCEIDEKLSHIANHNFKLLKAKNITSIYSNGIDYLQKNNNTYDWIFVDPSRRNQNKGKVFYLKDCTPNLVEHIETLLQYSNNIMIKASPMLDLSIGISELKFVKEIHIIAVNNEVKELIYIIEKDYDKEIKIITNNVSSKGLQVFKFSFNEEANCNAIYSDVQKYLYEPNAAIMKSGAFNLVSQKLKVNKLQINSHLYTSHALIDFPGRIFKVNEVIPYQKKLIYKKLGNQKFNVSTRNFPENIEALKRKYKIADGGENYVFFTKDHLQNNIAIVCKKP